MRIRKKYLHVLKGEKNKAAWVGEKEKKEKKSIRKKKGEKPINEARCFSEIHQRERIADVTRKIDRESSKKPSILKGKIQTCVIINDYLNCSV